MRVVAFPSSGIAYIDSFYAAVVLEGVEVVPGVWSGRWLLRNLKSSDVAHFHWPSFHYGGAKGQFGQVLLFARFLALIAITRIRAGMIVWTAHNLYPHTRSGIAAFDLFARRIVVAVSDRILIHGCEARQIVNREFPGTKEKSVEIPHGNWIERYGAVLDQIKARQSLGLPNSAFIYLLFGQCKPYKNIELLISSFLQIARPDSFLLIAGRFSDERYLTAVRAAAAGDRRIRIVPNFIPDHLVSSYLSASNIMCIPYTEILTSGSAMLAMSYGVPVISINCGFLQEVIDRQSGVLVGSGVEKSFASALRDARKIEWSHSDIICRAERYTFEAAAKIFVDTISVGDQG